ncbi:KpsF/GutQ family sugar-phosphate isomerase [Hyphobacterium sp. HN65]|uniref:KpsF/GutQ family sugar-phosphate isomerase n=1 Tax=Hyphobacterium lacteum TaxID=3116575 RepID=A0ABU7LQD0_9PROT|nr:KpsF/GutQ family sugar-phosphate isomerase [Hyphobacterium sp. HN65]MEE2525841.1 KpsF/GutQ family sugar-phosphate isomerase [Hyphobacterium sp. HN65]
MTQTSALDVARRVIRLEQEGLEQMAAGLDDGFATIVAMLTGLKGRVICAGVGKSGHVARKIAATLASTGTPSQFVHPTEASHGDLGMITPDDAVLALSKSGETRELGDIMAYCRRFGTPLIGMTCGADSALAKASDHLLLVPDAPEACAETRAPTTSTTLMMALGDALAVALLEARGFTARDFKTYHPGGALGAALATVGDLMHGGEELPVIGDDARMSEALIEISAKSLGCVGICNGEGALSGMITDGDLRRHMGPDLLDQPVTEVMTRDPKTVSPATLAADALRQMTAGNVKITQLFALENGKPVGLLHIHDLLRAGVK